MPQRDAIFLRTPMPFTKHTAIRLRSHLKPALCFRTGGRPRDGSPEPDFGDQVRLAFSNLEATFLAAGCGLNDIVDVSTFQTDPEKQFETSIAVKNEMVNGSRNAHVRCSTSGCVSCQTKGRPVSPDSPSGTYAWRRQFPSSESRARSAPWAGTGPLPPGGLS